MKQVKAVISGTFRKTLLATALLAAPVVSGFVATQILPEQAFLTAGSAYAQSAKPVMPSSEPLQPRRVPGVSQRFTEQLQEAAEVLEPPEESGAKPDPRKALQMLNEMAKKMGDYNPYEQVMLHTYYGAIYYQMEDTPNTIKSFEKLVALTPNLPTGTEAQYVYILGQLYAQEDQPKKALDYLLRWTKLTNMITPDQYSVFAQTFYQNDKFDDAMVNMQEAIRIYESEGKIPKEDWLSFMRALYFQKEDFKSTLGVVEQLVRHYPKMSYWRQLVGLYYELGRLDDYYRALDSMYVMGGLNKQGEILSLAGGFLDKEAPYKAAKILDKGIKDKVVEPTSKNLELLANSWRLSQETDKALVEMQKAASKSDDGDLYFNLARLLFAHDRYDDTIAAAKNALNKGGLKRPDSVQLTIGQAEIERGNFDEAVKAFKAAAKDERSRKFANQWMQYAESEKKRQDALKDS